MVGVNCLKINKKKNKKLKKSDARRIRTCDRENKSTYANNSYSRHGQLQTIVLVKILIY